MQVRQKLNLDLPLLLIFTFIYLRVRYGGACVYDNTCVVEVRCQAWQQAALPSEPFCWPLPFFYLFMF